MRNLDEPDEPIAVDGGNDQRNAETGEFLDSVLVSEEEMRTRLRTGKQQFNMVQARALMREEGFGMDPVYATRTRPLSQGSLPAESLERAIATLRSGRYPIVNEMETGLNRSLVGTVIELFASPVTNPKGATLLPKYPDVQAMRDYVCKRVNE